MAVAMIRTAILYILTVIALRCMGKRQLGELEPAELVITLLISDLATLCMQDLEMPLLYSVVPMATLVILEVAFSLLTMKVPAVSRLLGGKYSVLIEDGVISQREMRRSQMTVSELMEEIRQAGLMAVEDVKYCVLETDGKVSIIPKKDAPRKTLPLILISDGVPVKENLHLRGIDDGALTRILEKQGTTDPKRIFLLYEIAGKYTCVFREEGK